MISILFSIPQPTIEDAQAFHEYGLFNPAAIFATSDGFIYARIREMDSPPHKTARAIKENVGYTLVSYHSALLDVWQEYKP